MAKLKRIIDNLSKNQKIICLIVVLGLVLFVSIGIPSLARYKNRSTLNAVSVWDGTVASSYRTGTGTSADPYVISNGSELAYFASELTTKDYENTYFSLSNDIVINKGIFSYDITDKIKYVLDGTTYYIKDYTNKYYDNTARTGTEIGTVNSFASLKNFKGSFDGKSFRIYGLYMSNQNNEETALFTNLQGSVSDLYVENAFIYGGNITSGIASTATNATIKNVLFNGNVIGKSTDLSSSKSIAITNSNINVSNTETSSYISLNNKTPFTGSEITTTSLTGSYEISGASESEVTISINGQTVTGGNFNIDLGSNILNNVEIKSSTTSSNSVEIKFSNLNYNVTYSYGTSAGIVAVANNVHLENAINKGKIYGYSTSGGLVGVSLSLLDIKQSYNTGNINSNYVSGGLIGTIEKSPDNITISKSYNSGDMTGPNIGGLLGIVSGNTGSVSLSNVFNTSTTDYSIGTIANTTVNVDNAYFVNGSLTISNGSVNGTFTQTALTNLQTKNYDVTNLSLNEFVSFTDLETNDNNAWIYEDTSLPILFNDDISKSIASIHMSLYSWDNLSYTLNNVKRTSNITFSVEENDELVPAKEIYYYISNSKEPLTKTAIEQINSWTSYTGITQISTEGFYVIYAKVVDYNDNVTYINSDVLILDLPGASASIKLDNNSWDSLRSSLNNIYIDKQATLTINSNDNISGISSIKYYITDDVLTSNELDGLAQSSWIDYNNEISINEVGTYIIYVQITDDFDYKTYLNTDYIVYDGYTEGNLILGKNVSSYVDASASITDKSTITLNMSYSNKTSINLENTAHNIISNILLPIGTKLTLVDYITNKVYEYQIPTANDIYNYGTSCDGQGSTCTKKATYPLTLFKEVGTKTTSKYFGESTYLNNGTVNENFDLIMDLSNTDISINYTDVSLYMALLNTSGNNIRPTLNSTIKKFNIYSTVNSESTKASLYLNTDYAGNEIILNSDSITNINVNSGINYKTINSSKIIDTSNEDKEIGLAIKLVDSAGNTVNKDYLKNLVFKIGSETYYPGSDNIIRINLGSATTDKTSTLTVQTYKNNSSLSDGTYYLKISNYVSYGGYFYSELGDFELSFPMNVVSNTQKTSYSFDVLMDDSKRIISKKDNSVNIAFNALQSGDLTNPNIRVSLYKKDVLTAYNQNYTIVPLASYVSNQLNLIENNVYYVSTSPLTYDGTSNTYNPFNLDLITANFENTGYKFVFELYDGTKKIGAIEKYFIVK